jgi:hypothetical protein
MLCKLLEKQDLMQLDQALILGGAAEMESFIPLVVFRAI